MEIDISESFGDLTDETLVEFEAKYGINLPQSYREFLLRSNGGKVTPCGFVVPGWYGGITALARFYGIHSGKLYNLGLILEGSRDVLPPDFLAVAEDGGGNLITLGVKGKHVGKVYFWDHEDELDDEGESKMDMSNMFILADDFKLFLSKLFTPD